MHYNVLIVDDEKELSEYTAKFFNMSGVSAYYVLDAVSAGDFFENNSCSLILLDINLGDDSGFELCQKIRSKMNIPIFFISARQAEDDMLLALGLGGDDYICKPFNPLEVAARVKAFMRRYYDLGAGNIKEEAEVLKAMDLELDTDKCLLTMGGEIIELTSVEYKMMEMFMKNPGKVFTKQQLYEYAWGDDFFASDNNIMVAISKLRTKLDEDASKYIKTMRGLGYRLEIK